MVQLPILQTDDENNPQPAGQFSSLFVGDAMVPKVWTSNNK